MFPFHALTWILDLWRTANAFKDECDSAYGRLGNFAEATEKAQDAAKTTSDVSPHSLLPRSLLLRPGQPKPPLYRYGLPFTTQFAIDYARRLHLITSIVEENRESFYGRTVLNFGDLDEEWLASGDEDLESFAISVFRILMTKDLCRPCKFMTEIGRRFAENWDSVISLWSNYNFDERFDTCLYPVEAVEVLAVGMREYEGREPIKPQW